MRCGRLLLSRPLGLPLVWVQEHGGVEQGLDERVVFVAAMDQGQSRVHLFWLRDHLEVLVLGSV